MVVSEFSFFACAFSPGRQRPIHKEVCAHIVQRIIRKVLGRGAAGQKAELKYPFVLYSYLFVKKMFMSPSKWYLNTM